MTVQAFISISYVAESAAAVEATVSALALPDGAQVSASVSEAVVTGVVEGGVVTAPMQPPSPADSPPDGTVQEVLDWVGTDQARAQSALDAELAGQNRSTLVTQLEQIITPVEPPA